MGTLPPVSSLRSARSPAPGSRRVRPAPTAAARVPRDVRSASVRPNSVHSFPGDDYPPRCRSLISSFRARKETLDSTFGVAHVCYQEGGRNFFNLCDAPLSRRYPVVPYSTQVQEVGVEQWRTRRRHCLGFQRAGRSSEFRSPSSGRKPPTQSHFCPKVNETPESYYWWKGPSHFLGRS